MSKTTAPFSSVPTNNGHSHICRQRHLILLVLHLHSNFCQSAVWCNHLKSGINAWHYGTHLTVCSAFFYLLNCQLFVFFLCGACFLPILVTANCTFDLAMHAKWQLLFKKGICMYLRMHVCKHMSALWNCPMPTCQCARAQGSRAGRTLAPGHHTWPSHLLGLLILHSSPWQGNEPGRVAGSPHVTTMMGAYGRVQRATVDHALWDQGRFCLNYRPDPGPLGGLTAPQELGQMPWALDK